MSQQSRRRDRVRDWIASVRGAAGEHWDQNDRLIGAVAVTITYFFQGERAGQLDVDNIPKPILDGLKGLVFADDSQVFDLVCRKRDRELELQTVDATPVLLRSLAGPGPLIHIMVATAVTDEVAF
ncbi:MAG: RusA family crossover junction endodeoxyribonuclease [Chloroflexi bacterium]|nr:RusA family crossover junction endodeoxyribonuclease [Chloroflexota bacterium]